MFLLASLLKVANIYSAGLVNIKSSLTKLEVDMEILLDRPLISKEKNKVLFLHLDLVIVDLCEGSLNIQKPGLLYTRLISTLNVG